MFVELFIPMFCSNHKCVVLCSPPTAFHIWISSAELHTSVSIGVLWISKRLSNTCICFTAHTSRMSRHSIKTHLWPTFISEVNPDSCSMQISVQNKTLHTLDATRNSSIINKAREAVILSRQCIWCSSMKTILINMNKKFHNLAYLFPKSHLARDDGNYVHLQD